MILQVVFPLVSFFFLYRSWYLGREVRNLMAVWSLVRRREFREAWDRDVAWNDLNRCQWLGYSGKHPGQRDLNAMTREARESELLRNPYMSIVRCCISQISYRWAYVCSPSLNKRREKLRRISYSCNALGETQTEVKTDCNRGMRGELTTVSYARPFRRLGVRRLHNS